MDVDARSSSLGARVWRSGSGEGCDRRQLAVVERDGECGCLGRQLLLGPDVSADVSIKGWTFVGDDEVRQARRSQGHRGVI